jgi:Flp pilus assembly protein TadG
VSPVIRLLRRLRRDRRGIAITELAILAPVLMMVLMGLMDLSYQSYVQTVLEGAMQKAGRDSAIESADTATIDQRVRTAVQQVAKSAQLSFTRKSYSQFGNIKTAERFDDANGNNRYDQGECFYDVNANGQWDADPSVSGQGGANDVTLYTATASYPHVFPLGKLVGWPTTVTATATTLLKNQPYASQSVPGVTKICS